MILLPNEQQMVTANDDKIILTNQRIQLNDKYWGNSYQVTLALENVSSIEKSFKSYPILLVLGILSMVLGAFIYVQDAGGDRQMSPLFLFGGIVLIAAWFFLRKHIIRIKPNGGTSLDFIISGMGDASVEDFIYKVSLARENRINMLNGLVEQYA